MSNLELPTKESLWQGGQRRAVISDRISFEKSQAIDIDEDVERPESVENLAEKGMDVLFKLTAFEKPIFTLVYTMVKENEIPYVLAIALMIIEDLQLMSYSWYSTIVGTPVIRLVFNPFLAFVESSTLASHIISWIILLSLLASMCYCGISLSAGQLRYMAPLHVLRFVTIIVSTILYIPMLETFILPLQCSPDLSPLGYPNFRCNSSEHAALLSTGVIGAVLLILYGLIMSLLYFNWNVGEKGGKRHGRTDFVYVLIRIALVVLEKRFSTVISSAINTALLAILTIFFIQQQPFYDQFMNNLRAGIFTGAFVLSLSALIYSGASGPVATQAMVGPIVGGLCIILVTFIGIYFGNDVYVKWQCNRIYTNLKRYDMIIQDQKLDNRDLSPNKFQEIRKSYMDLVYDKTQEVIKRRAISEKICVFPGSHWVEIAARFVRNAYLDQEAISLANRLMEVGILQYSKSGPVYLAYLNYIGAYFPFLKGKEHSHVGLMLRKCSMQFDERFLVYLQQQSIRQLDQMGRIAGDDKDLQFTSYIEYQSLENAVKRCHVDTLVQLRDFWHSVRSDANSFTLSARLDRISASSSQTSLLYQKLINRFPNSRNILLLNSRFHAFVTADQEQALLFKSMADDLEANEKDAKSFSKSALDDNELEKRSAHSSGSSEASKESKLIRQRRTLLLNRLQSPMVDFIRKIVIFACIFVFVLITAVTFSKVSIDYTGNALNELDVAMISRRILPRIHNNIRRISYSAELNDSHALEKYVNAILEDETAWSVEAEPHYDTQVADPRVNNIILWDDVAGEYTIQQLNIHTAAELMSVAMSNILNYGNINFTHMMTQFSNRSVTSRDQHFRYIFDNVDAIEEMLDDNCLEVVNNFVSSVAGHVVVASVLYALLAIILLVSGLALPRIYLGHCYKSQDDVLGLFRKVPRSLILKFVTDLEVEIEVIKNSDDNLAANHKSVPSDPAKNNVTSRSILKWNYLLLLTLMLGIIPGMYMAVFRHLTSTKYIPTIFNDISTRNNDLPLQMYGLMQDIVVNDNFTWSIQLRVAKLREKLNTLKHLTDNVFRSLDPLLQDRSTVLFKVLRTGDCWKEKPEECAELVVPEIGYTEEIITSGVDTLMLRFIAEVEKWLLERNFKDINNPRLRLLELLTINLRGESREIIRDSILQIVASSIALSTIILFLLMGGLIGLGAITYYIGFFTTSQAFHWNNDQLVGLLYFIPAAERAKLPDLNTFIESGGAILNSN